MIISWTRGCCGSARFTRTRGSSPRAKSVLAELLEARLQHDIERIKHEQGFENLRTQCQEQQAEILRLRALTKHHTDVPETEESEAVAK